jgi:hypothetical protein
VANGRAAITSRRFPPPWSVEEEEACFIVRDHNGQALTYVYFEEEPGRRAAAKLLTRDESRRIAANVAKPGCLRRSCSPARLGCSTSIPNASSTRRHRAAAWRPP